MTALWRGEHLDRPCLCVTAPSGVKVNWPKAPTDPEAYWLDPTWMRQKVRAEITQTWWGAEAMPSSLLMAGWMVSLGGRPHFDMRTIWFEESQPDFSMPSRWRHNPADPWFLKYQALYCAVVEEAGWDEFLVGAPGGLPANDLLSMHMGTHNFLLALLDHPEWMRKAIIQGAEDLVVAKNEIRKLVDGRHAYTYGGAGWMPFWAPEPFMRTQSDVSCMLSPEMFEEFVLPELETYGRAFGAIWYHLDGRDAKQHLPRLLSMPSMRVIQYVPTPAEQPNGIAHVDLYRQIQEAGKIVHIQVSQDQVEPLCRALDPSRLMLMTSCPTIEAGRRLIANAVTWSRRLT